MTPRAQGKAWALRRIETAPLRKHEDWTGLVARLLRAEHSRAVRVVKKAERMGLRKVLDTDTNEYLEGYQQATSDILTALQRGRGGKG